MTAVETFFDPASSKGHTVLLEVFMRLSPALAVAATAAVVSGSAAAQKPKKITVSPQATDTTIAVGPNAQVHVRTFKGAAPGFTLTTDDSAWANRATLGMTLRTTGSKRDTLGLFVESVIPNGPAEKAGIVEGDRIAYIGDTDLRVAASDLEDTYVANVSLHRLRRQVTKLAPGAKAELRVYKDGRMRTVTVTAEKASAVFKGRPFQFHFGAVPRLGAMGPATAMLPSDGGNVHFEVMGDGDAPDDAVGAVEMAPELEIMDDDHPDDDRPDVHIEVSPELNDQIHGEIQGMIKQLEAATDAQAKALRAELLTRQDQARKMFVQIKDQTDQANVVVRRSLPIMQAKLRQANEALMNAKLRMLSTDGPQLFEFRGGVSVDDDVQDNRLAF